jgi:hypothetical protein
MMERIDAVGIQRGVGMCNVQSYPSTPDLQPEVLDFGTERWRQALSHCIHVFEFERLFLKTRDGDAAKFLPDSTSFIRHGHGCAG